MVVSVIIPTYNRAKVIVRSINSVLNQTFNDLELIIIDDCSTDNTENIVKGISDSRLRYIKLDKNSGACAARNRGIEEANGQLIAFQDSDDAWEKNKLELQIKALYKNDADIVFCSFNRFNSDGTSLIFPDFSQSHFCLRKELLNESIVSTQTILGKKEVFNKIKFDNSLPRMQDYDFIIRTSEKFSIYYLNECLVNVYLQDDSITARSKDYKKIEEITVLLFNKYQTLKNEYPQWEISMLKTIAHCQVMLDGDATKTLKEIYKKEKKLANRIKIVLNEIKLLKIIFSVRNSIKFKAL